MFLYFHVEMIVGKRPSAEAPLEASIAAINATQECKDICQG